MEKLVELLNKHRKEINGDGKWYIDTDNYNMLTLNNLDKLSSELWIISREYWFIKRLVDNDKIKWWSDKIRECWDAWSEYRCDTYENILINLALSDEPIKFLTEILK